MPSSGQDAVSQRGTGFPRPPFSCSCDRTEAPLAAFPVPAVNSPDLFLSLLQAPHGGGFVPAEIPSPALFAQRAKQGSAAIRHGSLRRITSYVPSTTLARISGGRKMSKRLDKISQFSNNAQIQATYYPYKSLYLCILLFHRFFTYFS